MNNIADINKNQPHSVANVRCMGCLHEWVSVYPTDNEMGGDRMAYFLECPNCGEEKTLPLPLIEDEQNA